MRQDGASYGEIAMRLGVTKGFVAGHLYRERKGMAPRASLGLSRAEVAQELDANGNNRAAAARKFGVHRSTIDRMTERKGNPGSARLPCRTDNPEVRALSDAIVRSGLTDIEIADRAGVSVSAIRSWRAGRNKPNPKFMEWVREAISRS